MLRNPTQSPHRSQRGISALVAGAVLISFFVVAAYVVLSQGRLATSIVEPVVNEGMPAQLYEKNKNTPVLIATDDTTAGTSSDITKEVVAFTPPTSPESQKSSHFGISVAQTLSGLSQQALEAELDDLVSLGIGWVRFDIDWSEIQPTDNIHYNWKNIDRIVAAANARGLKLLAMVGYSPRWARVGDCYSSKCAPADPEQFAHFVREAVRRYDSKGLTHWEVWNEPNHISFWKPQPDIDDYVTLLKATYKAIKDESSTATVISGGLAPTATRNGSIAPLTFVEWLYERGGGNYFDALGFHPYSFPVPPSYTKIWNAWSQMYATNPSIRSLMLAHGDGDKKIWLTEFGAPTGGPGTQATLNNYKTVQHPSFVSEALQATHLQEAFTLVDDYEWAGPVFWYSYKDLGTSSDTIENFFGLLRFDGSKKPAYTTLQEMFTSE